MLLQSQIIALKNCNIAPVRCWVPCLASLRSVPTSMASTAVEFPDCALAVFLMEETPRAKYGVGAWGIGMSALGFGCDGDLDAQLSHMF
jgi:hypothetical protein